MTLNLIITRLLRRRAAVSLYAVVAGLCLTLFSVNALAESEISERKLTGQRNVLEKARPSAAETAPGVQSFGRFAEPMNRYIITGEAAAVARYRGDVAGYQATSPQGRASLDVQAPEVRAYGQYLETQQTKLLQQIALRLGRSVEVVDQFSLAVNAIVVELTADEASRLTSVPGIRSIHRMSCAS